MMVDWSKELNINITTIYERYRKGYPIEQVLKKGSIKRCDYMK